MSKTTPEYDSLRSHLHKVCSSISVHPSSLVPLTEDLYGAKLIPQATRNATVNARGSPTYELAAQILTAIQVAVQFDQKKLYSFTDKLYEHGHGEAAIQLLKDCEKKGGRVAPNEILLPDEDDQSDMILSQEPTLVLFTKYIGLFLQDKWPEIGGLLGVPAWKLRAMSTSMINPSSAIIEVFDNWKKADEVEFTWKTLFTQLETSKLIESKFLAQARKNVKDVLTKP